MTPAARDLLRAARGPAIVLTSYLVLRLAFAALTEDDGLLTPESAPRLSVAALGLVVLALRLAVVLVLPAVAAFKIASRLLSRAR